MGLITAKTVFLLVCLCVLISSVDGHGVMGTVLSWIAQLLDFILQAVGAAKSNRSNLSDTVSSHYNYRYRDNNPRDEPIWRRLTR